MNVTVNKNTELVFSLEECYLKLISETENIEVKKKIVLNLLANELSEESKNIEFETSIIFNTISELSLNVKMSLLQEIKEKRINNARTRKIALKLLFNNIIIQNINISNKKVKNILQHIWGNRKLSIISSILSKSLSTLNEKEKSIINENIVKYTMSSNLAEVFKALIKILT